MAVHRAGENCGEGDEYDEEFDIHTWYPFKVIVLSVQVEVQAIISGLLETALMKVPLV